MLWGLFGGGLGPKTFIAVTRQAFADTLPLHVVLNNERFNSNFL